MACHRNGDRTKMFEVVYAALPRYFLSQFSTDVENLQITLDGAKEEVQNNETKVECERAKFIYTYKNQCQVIINSPRRATLLMVFRLYAMASSPLSGLPEILKWNGCNSRCKDTTK